MIDDWSNATFDRVRQIALWQGDERIEITVRADGRVTFVGASTTGANWRVEADLLDGGPLPKPNAVLHEKERKGDAREKWGG